MESEEDYKMDVKDLLIPRSLTYIRHRERANARKQRFLQNLTPEQRELKKAKDREYYHKKKAFKKRKSIKDMSEEEREHQRKLWRDSAKKYRRTKTENSS